MEKTLDLGVLLSAYSEGYFPMPEPKTEEIKWYRPDPRAIIPLDGFHCSRSLRRSLKNTRFVITYDKAFKKVMESCANRNETWINLEFMKAYQALHENGYAHSVEVWLNEDLVGGIYGVSIGGAFFAESKFHTYVDASKVALYHLVNHLRDGEYALLETQFLTEHLKSLGAIEISDEEYIRKLKIALKIPARF